MLAMSRKRAGATAAALPAGCRSACCETATMIFGASRSGHARGATGWRLRVIGPHPEAHATRSPASSGAFTASTTRRTGTRCPFSTAIETAWPRDPILHRFGSVVWIDDPEKFLIESRRSGLLAKVAKGGHTLTEHLSN